jgi:hypothetical protein
LRVSLLSQPKYENGVIDGVKYLRNQGEHLLCVKLVNWRKGVGSPDFINEIVEIVVQRGDVLINVNDLQNL